MRSDSCFGVISWDMTLLTGPLQTLTITSRITINQSLLKITVVAIRVPDLFGTRLLQMLVEATDVDPELDGYRLSKVTARHPPAKKLLLNFPLCVFVIQCHVR